MIKVKTLRPHGNAYGDKYQKAVDDEYELPEQQARGLIADKLVARAKAEEEPAAEPKK